MYPFAAAWLPGYKEVTLLGQNIDAYGRDLPGMAADGSGRRQHTFTDLLRAVHDVPGIERIRFATSHPRYFTGGCGSCCSVLGRVALCCVAVGLAGCCSSGKVVLLAWTG